MDVANLLYQGLVGVNLAMNLWLVAAGLTFAFGVLGVLNFAHGSLYMLGGYAGFTLYGSMGLNFWVSLVLAALSLGVVGVVIERFLLRPIYDLDIAYQLILTFGLVLVFSDLARIIWGGVFVIPPIPDGLTGSVRVFGRGFGLYNGFQIVAGVAVAVALWLLLDRTWWGRKVRATAADPEMASTLGIRTGRLFAGVFGLAAAVAGLGGALATPVQVVTPGVGTSVVISAFVITVIGGLGNLRGAFLGALIVGLTTAYGGMFFPGVELFLIYLIMALVLMVRPEGMFGEA